VPRALENLLNTAELKLKELFEASQKNDRGAVQTMLRRANKKLQTKMTSVWQQSKATIALEENAGVLSILVNAEDQLNSIAERSDGLKQFVSLFALVSQAVEPQRDVVLLIDEAERHLHYDAQADLIQMLAKQGMARKVIYTTHSFGSLPEDMGLGVRIVSPIGEHESKIVNDFWSQGGAGLSPLLLNMGAATMAFLPVRYCVLAEGAVDMLLLPSLFRELRAVETLGFQVAPGLAEAGDASITLSRGHQPVDCVPRATPITAGASHAEAEAQLRMLRQGSAAGERGGAHLHVRVHVLPRLRRERVRRRVPELRRQSGGAPGQAGGDARQVSGLDRALFARRAVRHAGSGVISLSRTR
jgi:AAA ATPase domain